MSFIEFKANLTKFRITGKQFALINKVSDRTVKVYADKFGEVQAWVKNLIEAMGSMSIEKREMFIESRLREINV